MPATSTASLRKGDDLVLGAFRGDTPVYNPLTFYRNFAQLKTLNHGIGPAIAFTRASDGTFFDADGVLQTATTNTPRFDHSGGTSLGLLIEEQRTNSIRNSQAGGAAVGTPGTLPTSGWEVTLPTGLSREIVATGTQAGFNYIDLRISGTRSGGTSTAIIRLETATQVVASTGQVWSGSVYLALIAGSFSQVGTPRLNLVERAAGGAAINTYDESISGATSSLQRFALTATMADATAARVNLQLQGSISDGNTVDFTLRIAAPQLEQGAFATSYIPTTGATATRSADNAVVTPISSFYNQAEGTMFAEWSSLGTSNQPAWTIDDGSINERMLLHYNINGFPVWFVGSGGITQAVLVLGDTYIPGNVTKLAGTAKENDFQAARDGVLGLADTDGVMPIVSRVRIGGREPNVVLSGHIRKIAYWPKRLSNELLQQLTT